MRSICGTPSHAWQTLFDKAPNIILQCVEEVWPSCALAFSEEENPLENAITRRLVYSLQGNKKLRSLYMIIPQYNLLDENSYGVVIDKGFIDIALFASGDALYDVYLAIECKRLNVGQTRQSLAKDYTEKGVMRFVLEQYAQELPVGIMLGYVLDGDIAFSQERILNKIEEVAADLKLAEHTDWEDRTLTTIHNRATRIKMIHRLLPFQSPN